MYLSNIFTYKSTSLCIINYSFLWNSRGLRDYHPRTMALRASLMPSLRTHSTALMPGYAGPNFTHFSSRRVAHPVGTLRGDQLSTKICHLRNRFIGGTYHISGLCKAYVGGYAPKLYGLIWYSTSILGSWNSH